MKVLTLKEAKERGLVEELKKRCDQMHVSVRLLNNLDGTHEIECKEITFIWMLVENSEVDLLKRRHLGRKSLSEVKQVLHDEHRGLELDTRLTDALKVEVDAPLTGNEPHEDEHGNVTMPNIVTSPSSFPSLEELQRKLAIVGKEESDARRAISDARTQLARCEESRRSLQFAIDNYATIALALS